jgi:S1-C subfamily serine protease
MVLGEFFIETIRTRDGRKLRASVAAVEPMADIAVLGAPDNQALPEDSLAFDAFVNEVAPVPLYPRPVEVDVPIAVLFHTHTGRWITGTVTRYGAPWSHPNGTAYLSTRTPIEGGTSGGPVVDRFGRLVGLVSNSSETNPHAPNLMPAPFSALPHWLVGRIMAAQ